MDLKEPKKKRNTNTTLESPLPVPIEQITGIPTSSANWKMYTGHYNGYSVVIKNSRDALKLFNDGFFGKGSLSRSCPVRSTIVPGMPFLMKKRQLNLHRSWANLDNVNSGNSEKICQNNDRQPSTSQILNRAQVSATVTSGNNNDGPSACKKQATVIKCNDSGAQMQADSNTESDSVNDTILQSDVQILTNESSCNKNQYQKGSKQQEERLVLVLSDTDEDDDSDVKSLVSKLEPELITDPYPLDEELHLSLEEAFFLSYALGCLKVLDVYGHALTLKKMWQLFCQPPEGFIERYVVYHYFRSKNWVVKSGLKFGGDFVLYKKGPPFYHASYIVKIEVEKMTPRMAYNRITWTQLSGLQRLAETAAKEVILCRVFWPPDLPKKALKSPVVLPNFKVAEILVRRWVPTKEVNKEDIIHLDKSSSSS